MSSPGPDVAALLRAKRDGRALTEEESGWILRAAATGTVDDARLTALVASIWFRGMEPDELAGWTRGMVASGETLDLRRLGRPVVDKHSTGGVGDKVSIPLAPLLAAAGCSVPMISGRGLGHTGGTLDKLEAVPGVSVELSTERIAEVVADVGAVICAQTPTLCPADRVLYALRDRVQLVESMPLIASSIVSKKVAEGLDALVLDVKCGSGAFLVDEADARALSETMAALGEASGVRTTARLTWMGRPLGLAVGHALEITECRELLAGGGPDDLLELVLVLGADLLVASGRAADEAEARSTLLALRDSGAGLEALERMLRAQGATGAPVATAEVVVEHRAERAGYLAFGDVRAVGYAAQAVRAGRAAPDDVIDPAAGVVWRAREGERVETGDVLALVHHSRGVDPGRCLALLGAAAAVQDEPPTVRALVLD
ncbi:MAG: thymidine phosphorylase [Planctomycetota bacterium]